ncbi:hypothetical protein B5V01_02190 [Mesorhizobium erdmanii]|uniref:Propionyl-coenzyme A carboxylase alpha polypeptide n=1 Tax=Mesorhizobium erdmanii TaxID=1777866 RepID=A0A4Q1VIZ8_9HYPH|nr:hypothetical protein B5V01_02190 [Mesorhizobium erdmanii]
MMALGYLRLAGQRPPLPCRASPSHRGRSDVVAAFANLQRWKVGGTSTLLISSLVGEMSGRTEGGAKDLGLSNGGRH